MTRLLLIGGGHAHVRVLEQLARQRPAGLEVTLVTPYERQLYSGMLPGWIAGHYPRIAELAIALAPLAARARVRFHRAQVTSLDLAAKIAHTDRGDELAFDLVSIAAGPTTDLDAIVGAIDFAVPLRPIEHFVETWQQQYLVMLSHPSGSTRVSFIGGGAGGVELALATAWRLRKMEGAVRLQLVTGGALLPSFPERARQRVAETLAAAQVRIVPHAATRIERGAIGLDDGSSLASDISILATGAAPLDWPRQAGLATDEAGFIAVNPQLQSVSHPFVFAAGDCAALANGPARARSGVYAVRAGPPLAHNLIAAATGAPLKPWRPQKRALYLLSEGAYRAVGVWGPLVFEGEWVWRWKSRIDRGFIRRFSLPETA
ncbi:MAG: FAD-dependent oxidoreductase [Burkholderiaceae bacterium]